MNILYALNRVLVHYGICSREEGATESNTFRDAPVSKLTYTLTGWIISICKETAG